MRSLGIGTTWDGLPALPEERVRLELTESRDRWTVRVDAPFHGDPTPDVPPGRCERLWEFEVVELFLVGPDEHYLELEFGPAGHWLGLRLHGARKVVDACVPIEYSVERAEDRWTAQAEVALDRLPGPILRWNAFAIHGTGAARRHLTAGPLPIGEAPDFHKIECFQIF